MKMGILLSELLVPGWADSENMIGLKEITSLQGEEGAMELPCHTADPEIFFAEDMATIARAKSACAACPMKVACLDGALSRGEPCGVWGGQLFDNGRVVSQKRTVGRPRVINSDDPIQVEIDLLNERNERVA
jgi:WhiB family redox-sensing transcriptional regulator